MSKELKYRELCECMIIELLGPYSLEEKQKYRNLLAAIDAESVSNESAIIKLHRELCKCMIIELLGPYSAEEKQKYRNLLAAIDAEQVQGLVQLCAVCGESHVAGGCPKESKPELCDAPEWRGKKCGREKGHAGCHVQFPSLAELKPQESKPEPVAEHHFSGSLKGATEIESKLAFAQDELNTKLAKLERADPWPMINGIVKLLEDEVCEPKAIAHLSTLNRMIEQSRKERGA